MPLPTLMIRGRLEAPNRDPELKKQLDAWVPVEYIIDWFRERSGKVGIENRVMILKSETASGKSTMFPPELYNALVRGTSRGIICTQPRIMTAIENVNEMLKWYSKSLRLGDTIGWSTKYNKLRPKSVGLLSATVGTLAQQLQVMTDDEIIAKYKFILIDETHERDLQTDMTIYMLKNLLLRHANNPDCPFVVLMSATFDPVPLLAYFGLNVLTNFVWCTGETAGFDEIWDWNEGRTVNNYPSAAASVVERIVSENPDDEPARADILIFMPGKAEFVETVRWLRKLNEKYAAAGTKVMSILQIESIAVQTRNIDFMNTMYVPVSEHNVVINGKKHTAGRRVIISTNVAETGLTLDNLKYVIDAGYNREIEFNPVYGVRGLITKPAPESRIRQRKGRAGRKFRGVFYPLYPKYIYDRLQKVQYPQILIEDVSTIMLQIIAEQLKVKKLRGQEVKFLTSDIDMVDVPTPDALSTCLEKLYTIGLITHDNLTELGKLASGMGLPPESARMILAAYTWDCSVLDIITIAAYLSMDPKSFIKSQSNNDDPDAPPPKIDIDWTAVYKYGMPGWISSQHILYKTRLLLADEFLHGIIIFNAIRRVIGAATPKDSLNVLRDWCDQVNLNVRACLDLIRARDDIIEQLLLLNMEIFAQEDAALIKSTQDDMMTTITKIKHCIYDGYRNNIILRNGTIYTTTQGLPVAAPKLFREDEKKQAEKSNYGFVATVLPEVMLYKELSMKYNRKTGIYDITPTCISTMDGFVSVDLDFAS
jgi:HrpA-like RNA helicase